MKTRRLPTQPIATLVVSALVAACGGRAERPPVVTTTEPPPATTTVPQPMPAPQEDVSEDANGDLIAMESSDPLGIRALDIETINERQPLEDVHFDFDSAVLSPEARATLDSHAELLETYSSMEILIEGHCDERGTVEYNLALGERRADAIRNYLTNLGISPDRMKTISYGKEFPLDPRHNEEAWRKNRRGHFEITSK